MKGNDSIKINNLLLEGKESFKYGSGRLATPRSLFEGSHVLSISHQADDKCRQGLLHCLSGTTWPVYLPRDHC